MKRFILSLILIIIIQFVFAEGIKITFPQGATTVLGTTPVQANTTAMNRATLEEAAVLSSRIQSSFSRFRFAEVDGRFAMVQWNSVSNFSMVRDNLEYLNEISSVNFGGFRLAFYDISLEEAHLRQKQQRFSDNITQYTSQQPPSIRQTPPPTVETPKRRWCLFRRNNQTPRPAKEPKPAKEPRPAPEPKPAPEPRPAPEIRRVISPILLTLITDHFLITSNETDRRGNRRPTDNGERRRGEGGRSRLASSALMTELNLETIEIIELDIEDEVIFLEMLHEEDTLNIEKMIQLYDEMQPPTNVIPDQIQRRATRALNAPKPTLTRFTEPLLWYRPILDKQGTTTIATAFSRSSNLSTAYFQAFDLAFNEIAKYQDTFVKRMDRTINEHTQQIVETGHDNIVDNVRFAEIQFYFFTENNLRAYIAKVVLHKDF